MDVIDVRHRPELQALADHIRKTRRVTLLRDADEEIARITPTQPARRGATRRSAKHLTADDSLWNIVGLDTSTDGPTDVSSNKHKYLAEAYLHEQQ